MAPRKSRTSPAKAKAKAKPRAKVKAKANNGAPQPEARPRPETGPEAKPASAQEEAARTRSQPSARGAKTSSGRGSVANGRSPPGRVALVPFPRKNQAPTEAEFAARLPLATGKKLDVLRKFLGEQREVTEALYFFGPRTGWAYRYLHGGHSLATVMIHGDRLLGIVAMDPAALSSVDFAELSDVARQARRAAHGTPALSWLDLPLDGAGAADFKALVRAKLTSLDRSANRPALTMAARPLNPPVPPSGSSSATSSAPVAAPVTRGRGGASVSKP